MAERRQALLRRLNQITHQRNLLQQRASRDGQDDIGTNGHKPASESQDELDPNTTENLKETTTLTKGSPRNSADSNSQRARKETTKPDISTNGKKKRQSPFPKRRRAELDVEHIHDVPTETGDDAESDSHAIDVDANEHHVGRPSSSKRHLSDTRRQTEEKAHATRRDTQRATNTIQRSKSTSNKGETGLRESNNKKTSDSNAAPASSSHSTRGSGRVRTPSVLLTSQPGEKNSALAKNSTAQNKQAAHCLKIVKEMLRLKDGFGFSKPIDQLWSVDQLPGYFEMITNPMDLDTVRSKIESGHYSTTPGKEEVEEVTFDSETFASDMRLIFSNARTYNRPGDIFYEAANRLSEKFESRLKQMPSLEQIESQTMKKQKKRKKGQVASSSVAEKRSEPSKKRKTTAPGSDNDIQNQRRKGGGKKKASQPASKTNASSAKASKKRPPKPEPPQKKSADAMSTKELETRLGALKRQRTVNEAGSTASSPSAGGASFMAQAQALYHIEMTYEEKVQLSHNVGRLPPDKLQRVFSLATRNKASSMEVNNNEEVELDIGSLSNKTLREIEAYVNQTLFRKKKNLPGNTPNVDIFHMSNNEINAEIHRITTELKKRIGESSHEQEVSGEGTSDKKRSFYDSETSSESDSDGSGSDSASESSSSEASDSSDDEPDGEQMQRRREKNLAHHRAMQAAGTPLASPSYQSSGRSGQ